MAFDAGSITGSLGLDASGFTSGILEAQGIASIFPAVVSDFIANPLLGAAEAIKEAFKTIEETLGGNLTEIISHVGESLHQLSNEAMQAGVSVSFLSSIAPAANEAGVATEELGEAMKFLNRNAADAATGNKDLAMEFMRLGVSVRDASGQIKPTEQLFADVADAISRLPSVALQTEAAMDLLGRSGAELLPFLKEGAAGMREYADAMDAFGATVTTKAAGAGDAFSKLNAYWNMFIDGIQKAIALPVLTFIEQHMTEITEVMKKASQVVRGEIAQAFAYLSGTIIPAVIEAFGFLREHSQTVLEVLGAIGGAIAGTAIAGAFALLGPIVVAVGSAIGGLATAWAALAGAFAGASSIGDAKQIFSTLWQLMQEFWAWIKGTAIPTVESDLTAAFNAIKPVIAGVQPVLGMLRGMFMDVVGIVRDELVPVIGKALAAAFGLLEPVLIGVGNLFKGLAPLVSALWSIIKGVVSILAEGLNPLLDQLTPVLKGIGTTIEWLLGKIGELMSWLGTSVAKLTDFVGLTHGAAAAAAKVASAGSSVPHGVASVATFHTVTTNQNASTSSQPSISTKAAPGGNHAAASPITVNVMIDPQKTGQEISKVIHPAIQKVAGQVKAAIASNARTQAQRGGL